MNRLRALFAFVTSVIAAAAFSQLPAGFTDEPYAVGLKSPVAMAFAPDGRLLIAQKGGVIRLVTARGTLRGTRFATLNVSTEGERGLLGIAFDPDFSTNNYVYVYYTTNANSLNPPETPKNRLSRLTADGDVALADSEVILLDNIPGDSSLHNSGCLRFGPDGKLYVSTGDGGPIRENSQNLTNLAGKILRINKDGTAPEDNPFVNIEGARPEIFCYGLRNPFRFCFRPNTTALYIADVGQNTWEEINLGLGGENFGWPNYEGPTDVLGYTSPLFAYRHTSTARGSIIGGTFMAKGVFPLGYNGSYYFADFVRNEIYRLSIDDSHGVTGESIFHNANGVVDFVEGADGALYYISISAGEVRRIRYRPNLASVSINPTSVVGGSRCVGTVTLDAPASAKGSLVTLSSTSGVTIPSAVTVLGGATTASFAINTASTSEPVTVTITASRNGIPQTATLTVNPAPSAEFISQSVPTTMTAGQTYTISVVMKNNGSTTWTDAAGYRLSSYGPPNNTTWGINRIFLPSDAVVEPGQEWTFTKTVRAPAIPGTYNMQWRMLLNGVGTFGQTSPSISIQVTAPANNAEFISQEVPVTVKVGETFTASMTFQNTGSATWSDATGYRLSSYSPSNNTIWGANRIFFPADVTVVSGANYTFSRTFRAPTTPGVYTFQWKMLQNGVGTFGATSQSVLINVEP